MSGHGGGFQVQVTGEQPDGTRVRWFQDGQLREIYRVVPGCNSYDWTHPTCEGVTDSRRWFEYGEGCSAWWTWGELLSQAWDAGVDKLNVDRSGASR